MSAPTELSFHYSWPNGTKIETNEVDSWELKTSRRALRNLKTLLAGQPMLDLRKDQIEEADAYYKDIIARSNGEYRESRVDLHAKGISKDQFEKWWEVLIKDMLNPELKQQIFIDALLPSHPEHYASPANGGGIIETIGEHIARVIILPCVDPPDFVKAYADPSYVQLPAIGTLNDGTTFCYIYQEIRDTDEGCAFRLRLLFPSAAPEVFFVEHAEHLAVEFRNFINTAYEWNKKQSAASS